MPYIHKILKTLAVITALIPLIVHPGLAQNVRVQSGIVAATAGLVRVVSEDIGRIAETGQKIYLNDVVETGDGGKMQIMLMDRTTMTIGPNTSLVIDEFVFDPGVERTLSATVLKGTFKLASPTLFNQGAESREIKLPNAVVAIRGTELIGSISDDIQNVVLLNGAITVANNDFVQDIDRPNFGVSISETGEISPPEFFSSDDLGILLNQLEGSAASGSGDTAETDNEASSDDQDDVTEEETVASTEDQSDDDSSNAEGATEISTTAESATESDQGLFAPNNEGPEPTEAEVVAAAEAIADGSADIKDLQTLSRAGPENIEAVANVLGVQFDEETGDITQESQAILAPRINTIIAEGGLIAPELGENGLEIPELSLNFEGDGDLGTPQLNFNFNRQDRISLSEQFSPKPIDGSGFESSPFESVELDVEFSREDFFAPVVEFDPVVFEGLAEFTSFKPEADVIFEPRSFALSPANFGFAFERRDIDARAVEPDIELMERQYDDFDNELSVGLDNLVTEALEEVINEISLDLTSILPEGTYIPEKSSYRSWNGSEWRTIARNFESGVIRFEHNNAVATFASGSYCQDCEAVISNTVTIDFNSMKYHFDGAGVFQKPGYNNVEFSASTPLIPLNYWELSSGTISRLPNERELESIYDNPEVYTLTSTADPNVTVDATIDLDFLYDTQLSDNRDLNSNLGVYGYSEIEYTETGQSEVTLRTPHEGMTPILE